MFVVVVGDGARRGEGGFSPNLTTQYLPELLVVILTEMNQKITSPYFY